MPHFCGPILRLWYLCDVLGACASLPVLIFGSSMDMVSCGAVH